MPSFVHVLLCALVLSATWIDAALGAAHFTIVPTRPTTNDIVRVRMDFDGTCDQTGGFATIDTNTGIIDVTLGFSDACDLRVPNVTPRFIDIGRLPAGDYRVRFIGCVNAPPPLDPCSVFRTEALSVFAPGTGARTIPALSWSSLVALVCAVLLALMPRSRAA